MYYVSAFVRIDYALNHMHNIFFLQSVLKMAKKNTPNKANSSLNHSYNFKSKRKSEQKWEKDDCIMLACLSGKKFKQDTGTCIYIYSITKRSHIGFVMTKRALVLPRECISMFEQWIKKIHKLEYNCCCLCIQIGLQ